jgi:PAS domain S-box-containing protein
MEPSYRQYFDAMPCYVSVQNRDFHVINANARFRSAFGDFQGRYCYQVYKNRPEKCEICPVDRTFRDGRSHHSEEKVRTLDGAEISVIVYTEPIRDEIGEISAVMEVSTDITDVKQLQNQLRESQARYHTLFEEVPCFLSIQDPDLNIIDANRAHRESFGNFLGCKCYKVWKHRGEECYPCIVRETFNDGQVHTSEEVVTSLQGKAMNVLVRTAPIFDASGALRHVMEMSTDISRIRELQSQLASIGLLISSISHGIKGLLNGLNGGVYLVNSGIASDNRARLKQGWEIVQRNVNRIRSMVLDILYYAKDREPDWKLLSSSAAVDDVYDQMSGKARELTIELEKAAEACAGEFEGDERAIRAMLVNLVENSLDACRVDRKKQPHRVALRATGDQEHVQFEIEDNGIGMDQETREKAFSLFFSSKGTEGTGLGLFIANKIATAHGGSIRLESQIDLGTRFLVRIPRQRAPQGAAGRKSSFAAGEPQ